jgi:glycosyltransferase involved in cell wall biosynthesis
MPFGILHIISQKRAFKKIVNAAREGLIDLNSVELIHAHKLTFEGYIGYLLSRELGIPLIVTLRQTDTWVFSKRKDLLHSFKAVIKHCSNIIFLIPSMSREIQKIVGDDFFNQYIKPKLVFIPNIVERQIGQEITEYKNGLFLTILRVTKESVNRKNIKNLLKALVPLKQNSIKLRIIGSGNYLWKLKEWVREFDLTDIVEFLGNIPNDKIDKYYSEAEAFLLPSKSESFGMVYAEALLNGTPIMFGKDVLGFDGIFENVGVGVYPNSVKSITEGIKILQNKNVFFRETISNLQSKNKLNIFSPQYVQRTYSQMIEKLLI